MVKKSRFVYLPLRISIYKRLTANSNENDKICSVSENNTNAAMVNMSSEQNRTITEVKREWADRCNRDRYY